MVDFIEPLTRRAFLGAAIGFAAVAGARMDGSAAQDRSISFPKGFLWGAGHAAYQVEGAWKDDGRGESIWDRFCRLPGKIKNGGKGDVACDFYSRYPEDVRHLASLGLNSYRFSVAWPRIQPSGSGKANPKGLDFYQRLVDTLLEARIRPVAALYHWDLPQALEDSGGWPKRDTAQRFADYAEIIAKALGDRLGCYVLFNEPWTFTALGYLLGTHAPGRADLDAFLYAIHTVGLAQGMAFRAIKASRPKALLGSAFGVSAMHPARDSAADRQAAERAHMSFNVWFLEAALKGRYPDALVGVALENLGVKNGDMERVRAPLDFVWINHYAPSKVSASAATVPDPASSADSKAGDDRIGLREMITRLTQDYGRPVIEVSQCGCDYGEVPGPQGILHDPRRIDFHRSCLAQLAQSIRDGADIRSYHVSNLTDGFEWAEGYTKRFGLIYVDYGTQQRTIKESGRWYARTARRNILQ